MSAKNSNRPNDKSTNGRFVAIGAASLALRGITMLSPEVAGQMASRLFRRPRRFRRPDRERVYLEGSEPFTVPLQGHDLLCWSWGPENSSRTAVLVHGWEGRGSQLGAFVAPLVAAGFRVIAFDAPGHGDSPGSYASPFVFRDALLAIADDVGPIELAIGHSFGSFGVALAAKAGLEIGRVVLVAPPTSMLGAVATFSEILGLSQRVRGRMIEDLEDRAKSTLAENDLTALARTMPMPLLLLHDDGDRQVPVAAGKAVAAAWPDSECLITQGLGHRRVLRDPSVVSAVEAFATGIRRTRPGSVDLDRWFDASGLAEAWVS